MVKRIPSTLPPSPALPAFVSSSGPLFNLPTIPHNLAASLRRYKTPSPSTTPEDLFSTQVNGCTVPALRYINKSNNREALIYIDGSCLGNGQLGARAGYGIRWGPEQTYASPLDRRGAQTSNRAELKCVSLLYDPIIQFSSFVSKEIPIVFRFLIVDRGKKF